jgi:hypothetical protein
VSTALSGTVICLLLGMLFFGLQLTRFDRPPVYFLVLGFAGSLSLALLRQKKVRDVIYINVLIYFMFAIVASVLRPITALVLLIYYLAIVLALFVYVRNFDARLARMPLARPLMLAAIVGVFFIVANLAHSLLFINHFSTRFLLRNLPMGFLLGLGYGLGEEVSERYLARKRD